MTCQWCGDRHGVDQLCQRAQRGMTRRSFCFLFGAGVAGALVAGVQPSEAMDWYLDRDVVLRRRIYRSSADGRRFKLIATITDSTMNTWTDNVSGVTFDNLPIVGGIAAR